MAAEARGWGRLGCLSGVARSRGEAAPVWKPTRAQRATTGRLPLSLAAHRGRPGRLTRGPRNTLGEGGGGSGRERP